MDKVEHVRAGSNMESPWGKVEHVTAVGPGIKSVSTCSHGGFKVDPVENAKIPELFRRANGWYEEDCEAYIVAYFLLNKDVARHLKNWYWREWEAYTGTKLEPGESYKKDQESFEERNAGNYIVRAAWGDWHPKVPSGMVGVLAKRGQEKKYFLVPKEEYGENFVINGHKEWLTPPS